MGALFGKPREELDLVIAANEGDAVLVQALIDAGADVNQTHEGGATPLFVAAQKNHLQVVKALIAAGADVDKV
jgi:ankyrin repeat protein